VLGEKLKHYGFKEGVAYKNGRVEIIPNDQGNRITPSYVAFTEDERLIGEAAKNQATVNPSQTLFDMKRPIGRCSKDSTKQKDIKSLPPKMVDKSSKPFIAVNMKGKEVKHNHVFPRQIQNQRTMQDFIRIQTRNQRDMQDFIKIQIQNQRVVQDFIKIQTRNQRDMKIPNKKHRKDKRTAQKLRREVKKQEMEDSGLKRTQVDEIVPIGTSTPIQKVQQLIKDPLNGKEPNHGINPDGAVPYGAAVKTGILSDYGGQDFLHMDVTPSTVGIETVGGVMTKLISRSTVVPTKTKTPEAEARTCPLAQVFDTAALDTECGDTIEQSADGSSDQVDAGDMEDWCISGLMPEHTKSICSAASGLEETSSELPTPSRLMTRRTWKRRGCTHTSDAGGRRQMQSLRQSRRWSKSKVCSLS